MMKWRPTSLLFVILLLSVSIGGEFHGLALALAPAVPEEEPNTMRLELIHRHSPQLLGEVHGGARPNKTRLERIKELVHRDIIRYRIISHKRGHLGLNTRRKDLETSMEMPMRSGADSGTGEYFVEVKVGSPAQKFMVIADTGSELTWVNCRYRCGKNCHPPKGGRLSNQRRVYQADLSSSFRTIPCSTQMCKTDLMNLFSLTRCPTPSTPCAYDFSYMDGSSALGFFANDTITVGLTNGRKMRLKNVLIGCTQSALGDGFMGADGVLGLGNSNYTFAQSIAKKFGGKFSYCLVDHLSPKNISNYLLFGCNRNEYTLSSKMQRTSLLLGVMPPFYAVKVLGISIGGVMLRIPSEVWDANFGGGTILDSGTSLTFLADPAYKAVMSTLEISVSKYKRLFADIKPFEYCFDSTGFEESLVPRLAFHFAGRAQFTPPVKSFIIDVAPQQKCLGFISAGSPATNIIGNIMQQNHFWEFDIGRSLLHFAPSSCT